MTIEQIKKIMDACYLAKRVREMLPNLPQGVAPSYIQYLDVIQKLERQKGDVKVSDISDVLELPRPGVTRTVKEMEAKGYLRKASSREDGRSPILQSRRLGQVCLTNMTGNIMENWHRILKKFRRKMWKLRSGP